MGYLNQLMYSLNGLAAASFQGSHWVEGKMYATQACALAERLRNDLVLGHTLALLASGELRQADISPTSRADLIRDSVQHGERGVELLAKLPPSESLGLAHGYLAESYLASGDHSKAVQQYSKSIAVLEGLKLFWLRDATREELGAKLGLTTHQTGS